MTKAELEKENADLKKQLGNKGADTKSIMLNEGPHHGQYAQIPKNKTGGFFTHNGNNYRITDSGYAQFAGADRKPEEHELVPKKKD